MRIDVHIVNSLTDGEVGGNPAGVVIDADALNVQQKCDVARQVGLSETAFVSKSDVATVKLEFFTPTRQIAHCGHATIATFSLLRELGRVNVGELTKETIDGCRTVVVGDHAVMMEQSSPTYSSIAPGSDLAQRVARSIGLRHAQIYSAANPTIVNTGNSFLMIALPDRRSVADVRPDNPMIEEISNELGLIGYYLFSTTTIVPARHAGARMFAPRFGINEESATGTAAGPLACFLYEHMHIKDPEIVIEQGQLMQPPSPSVIKVMLNIDGGRITRLLAGGGAKVARSMSLEV
ncbi:PhzF family phenazine biosynthesis protein [Burkholderia cepacia]|uniref:PhzF family phenazine biosynthesis protein n=1 Tax=Burkholderia cepacia TaxID=292 RepID=UPI00158FEB35|nr:PhzF family phenazine biosynthesis protein [Burkholderia cepacia]